MSDERMDAEQVLAQAIAPYVETVGDAVAAAAAGLAALRDAGFEWYRPEECIEGHVCDSGKRDHYDPVIRALPSNSLLDRLPMHSRFRLVPMSGETPKESE